MAYVDQDYNKINFRYIKVMTILARQTYNSSLIMT